MIKVLDFWPLETPNYVTYDSDIMESRSCFVCESDYELPSKKAHILDCCQKRICYECLVKIYTQIKKCPYCQKPFIQRQLADFPLDIEIEEKLNFEKLESNTCNQCQEDQEGGPGKAIKMCVECGIICNRCFINHTTMKFLKPHKIGSIPFDHLSHSLKAVLSESLNCEKHKDKKIESFCKNCSKAVCEKCIVESHAECQSQICTIDNEVQEIITDLQKNLEDNVVDVKRVDNIHSEAMKKQKQIEENMKIKITRWTKYCSEILKKTNEEVEISFQNKAKRIKETHEKLKEHLQEITASQGEVQRFIHGATSVHNKVGILRTAHKVRKCIQNFQKVVIEIEKELHKTEDRDADYQYADFVTTFCSKLNESISDYTSSDEKGSNNSRQWCRQNSGMIQGEEDGLEKCSHAKFSADERENSVQKFKVKYKKDMFPRYKYHLELIKKIVDWEQEVYDTPKSSKGTDLLYKRETDEEPEHTVDPEIRSRDVSTSLQSNIQVYGRVTDEIRKLLHPLEIQEAVGNDKFENVILVAFSDEIDADSKTSFYSTIQEQMNKCCWCILISSETDTEKLLKKSPDRKFSIVPPDTDEVWNHITSAMELKLIEFLNVKSRNLELPLSIREDVMTVLRRIQHCSDIKRIQKSNEIPCNIQVVLIRFENAIVRYGFHFDNFRVVVKNEKFEEVNEAIKKTGLNDINVIREDELVETIIPFNGNLQSQGRKLFDSNDQDEYGTLGCLALLNERSTVALTCKHVCEKDKFAFIYDNDQIQRICLGKCLYTSDDESKLDFAIIEVNSEVENKFHNKKLLDYLEKPRNAEVFTSNKWDFHSLLEDEIVYKIGATSKLTIGKIIDTQCIENVYLRIKVRGMFGKKFGKRGDSGSIVFKEPRCARKTNLEVVAMFLGGCKKDKKNIVCTLFKTAEEQIKRLNNDIKSVTFFND